MPRRLAPVAALAFTLALVGHPTAIHAQAPVPPVGPPVVPVVPPVVPVKPPQPIPTPIPAPAPAPHPQPAPAPPVVPIIPVACIAAPASVPPGAPLVLFADGSISATRLSWILIAPKGPFDVVDAPGLPGGIMIVRRPMPGAVYRVALLAFGSGQGAPPFAVDLADVPVGSVPGPTPVPTPVVPPIPTPVPTPVPSPTPVPLPTPPNVVPPLPPPSPTPTPQPTLYRHLQAVLVFDLDEPSTAHLRVSDIRAQLAALDTSWYVAPTGTPVAVGYRAYVERDGSPSVFIVDPDSKKVVATVKAPTRPADVVDAVKKLRGIAR